MLSGPSEFCVIQIMKLFKYTTYSTGLKILLEKKFRYTQPICFNDPFELYPIIEDFFTGEQLDEMLDVVTQSPYLEEAFKNTIDGEYNKLNEFQKTIVSYDQYYSFMKTGIQKELERRNVPIKKMVRDNIENNTNDFASVMNIEYHKLINSIIGILSLSKINDSILMWSHYCNSHTGIVLKITADKSYLEYLDEVNYPESNERPRIKLSKRDYSPQESIDAYKRIFFSKSTDWSYENEFRDHKPLINGFNTNLNDEAGFPIILFDFPDEIIEGVIFGFRVSDDKILDFMDKTENFSKKISYEKAFLDQEKYELNIRGISKVE